MQMVAGTGWPPAEDRARMVGVTTPVGPDEPIEDESWNWQLEPPSTRNPIRVPIPRREIESGVWYFAAGVLAGAVMTTLGVIIGAVT